MLETIEEIFQKEVQPFTSDILKLRNNSRPILYREEDEFLNTRVEDEFLNTRVKNEYAQTSDNVTIGYMKNNLIIHINPYEPERYALIMAYFQPKAFFIEKSELGKSLAKNGIEIDINDSKYSYLDGIGRWVEIKLIDRMRNTEKKMNDIKKELEDDVKSAPCYQAFLMCNSFWDAAQKTDLNSLVGTKDPEPGEIIAASILAASRLATSEEDLYNNFNKAFSRIGDIAFRGKGKSIVDIYHIGGMYRKIEKIVVPVEDIRHLENIARDLGFLMATEKQISEIGIALEKTISGLSKINEAHKQNPFTRFYELSSAIYADVRKVVDANPGKTFTEIGTERPVLKKMLTDFLINYSNQLSEYLKEANGSS